MHDLRRQYTMDGLVDDQMHDDPFTQFRQWFDIALQSGADKNLEVNAMTLATASSSGEVSARIVLLKGVDDRGLMFYTNYDSEKGLQLQQNPRAALLLFWPHLERQVRVEGSVEKLPRDLSEQYFHSRPRGSQIGAAISAQSRVLESREELEALATSYEQELAGAEVPLPDSWGGYRLLPQRFEFWQGRVSRLHDRINYVLTDGVWQRNRLAP